MLVRTMSLITAHRYLSMGVVTHSRIVVKYLVYIT